MTINPDLNPGDITNDPIVNEVVKLILDRHIQGMDKFGKTMESNERPLDQWIAETIEELLDAVHYLTKAKSITDKFKTKEKLLNDLLEKAPGIGLRNLIGKMRDKGITLDPGLMQQVHLLNNIRIYSVHKKKEMFLPSKQQTYATILYTTDIVGRLF